MSPLSIVIADDRVDTAESLAMLARIWGYEVNICHNRESILECCYENKPDVVLLDLGFPRRCDGLEAAVEIKSSPLLKDVVIVAITGFSDNETRELAFEAGCDHFFLKPPDPSEIEKLLESIQARVTNGHTSCV